MGIIEKCIVWFLVYLFERGFFIKSAKRMFICDYVKNRIGTCKKCVFQFEKGYKRMNVQDSPKTHCYQHVKRFNYQVIVWKGALETNQEIPEADQHAWGVIDGTDNVH